MKLLIRAACLSATFALTPIIAMAQSGPVATPEFSLINASDPQGIASWMQRLGYRALLTTDSAGDPKINSAASGSNFGVWFYGCKDGKNCKSFRLSTGYTSPEGLNVDSINSYNSKSRYTKAYIGSDGNAFINMDVATYSGIGTDTFSNVLAIWEHALAEFKKHINF